MEKLTVNKKVSIIDYYLSGLSYKEIAAKGHVSKGSVINIVMELKMGQFPGGGRWVGTNQFAARAGD